MMGPQPHGIDMATLPDPDSGCYLNAKRSSAKHTKALRDRRRALNQCANCGQNSGPMYLCWSCAKQNTERIQALRQRRKLLGLCIDCTAPVITTVRCAACLERNRASKQ